MAGRRQIQPIEKELLCPLRSVLSVTNYKLLSRMHS